MSAGRWILAPIRVERAIAASAGDRRCALIAAVIFAVPTHDVGAFAYDGTPLRIPDLIGEAWPHHDAEGAGHGRDEERQLWNEDFHGQ